MNEKNYPTSWISFDSYVGAYGCDGYEFPCQIADVNRFGARFRLAASFREILLQGYGDETAKGYGALFKVFLAWSAFETFMEVFSITQKNTASVISAYPVAASLLKIQTLDKNNSFYKFIYERVNRSHQKELDEYFASNPCNPIYLASAIRHIFAHGPLTPNANEVSPIVVSEICEVLYELLMNIMDNEFSNHIEKMNKILAAQR